MSGFLLSDLVSHVANELRKANNKVVGSDTGPVIELQQCEIELKVSVTSEGQAGIKFYVLSGNVKEQVDHTSTIKLSFKPVDGTSLSYESSSGDAVSAPQSKKQAKRKKT